MPAPSHADVVTEVERGNADFGVIAIENSTGGPVEESQDRLVETRLQVCDEITIPISQYLLSRGPIEQVKTVYAHQQSLSQTRTWVAQNLPGRNVEPVASNGLAAQRASEEEPGAAAIGPQAGRRGVRPRPSWPRTSRTTRTITPGSGSSGRA